MLTPARAGERGFTLLEMMVTVSIMAILLAIGIPSLADVIRRGSVSSAAELIQNALRQAETEAIRRNAEVEFLLTDDTPSVADVATLTSKVGGRNWAVRVVDATADRRYVNGYASRQLSDSLVYEGPASIRFNGAGRVLDSNSAAVSAKQVFRVSRSGADVAYCIFLTPGGAIKMCNPALSSGNPRACQPMLTAQQCPAI